MADEDIIIAATNFGTFAIPRESADRWPARTVLGGKRWEPETTDAVCRFAHTGNGDVVHAGAFFGDALPDLSRAIDGSRIVWAFEPNPANWEAAERTADLNGLANVEVCKCALGKEIGKLQMRTHDNEGAALGSVSRITEDGVEVMVMTIDSMVRENHVAVIHLDLEGWELPALTGAVRTINRCLPALVLEAKGGDPRPFLDWCSENVTGAEYRHTGTTEANVILEAK